MPAKTAPCDHCQTTVALRWYANENDPGDQGYIRTCGHGTYVTP